MNNILITSAGRRVELVRAFQVELKKKFPTSKVYTAEVNPEWSSACRISDGFFTIPRVDNGNYINSILEQFKKHSITMSINDISKTSDMKYQRDFKSIPNTGNKFK